MKVRCIAIDDEPAALGILQHYMQKTPFLEPCGTFLNPLEALDFLNSHAVDLLFLDIHMPDLNGIDLLRSLKRRPKVIFTTSHREYALEGFQLNAVDYLLKPITFAQFLKAANKVRDFAEPKEEAPTLPKGSVPTPLDGFLFIKVDQMMVRLNFADIAIVEGNRDYLLIHTRDGRSLLTLQTLSQLLEKLPAAHFARVHRSFIVNLSQCDALDKHHVQLGKRQIPIGKSYREAVFTRLQDFM